MSVSGEPCIEQSSTIVRVPTQVFIFEFVISHFISSSSLHTCIYYGMAQHWMACPSHSDRFYLFHSIFRRFHGKLFQTILSKAIHISGFINVVLPTENIHFHVYMQPPVPSKSYIYLVANRMGVSKSERIKMKGMKEC